MSEPGYAIACRIDDEPMANSWRPTRAEAQDLLRGFVVHMLREGGPVDTADDPLLDATLLASLEVRPYERDQVPTGLSGDPGLTLPHVPEVDLEDVPGWAVWSYPRPDASPKIVTGTWRPDIAAADRALAFTHEHIRAQYGDTLGRLGPKFLQAVLDTFKVAPCSQREALRAR